MEEAGEAKQRREVEERRKCSQLRREMSGASSESEHVMWCCGDIQSEDDGFLSTLNSTHSHVECHGFHTSI